MSLSSPQNMSCPKCSAQLRSGEFKPGRIILCGRCGNQFRLTGDWPVRRISLSAMASLALGVVSIVGICFTGIPAFLLGMWALSAMQRPRRAEILLGRRMAIVGASLGGISSLVMFALPLLVIPPMQRFQARERELAELNARALAHARRAEWQEAAGVYVTIIEMQPAEAIHWLRAAPLVVRSGDDEAYRRLCERMLERFGDTRTPHVAEKVSKACLLIPTTDAILQQVSGLAASATRDPNDWAILYAHVVQGWSEYRQASYSAAIKACQKTLSADPNGEIWYRTAQAHLIRAMSYSGLGRDEQALNALQQAQEILETRPMEWGWDWHDEIICRILLEECEATVKRND